MDMDLPTFYRYAAETLTVIVGFSIFYWVLRKYAWGPVLDTIDERQNKIQEGFDEVKKLQDDAAEAHKRYEEKIRGIEAEARTKIQEAANDGRRIATEITEKARADAAEITEKAKQNINLEVETARKRLREQIIDLTIEATEKIIHERLSEAKDRELVGSVIAEIEGKTE